MSRLIKELKQLTKEFKEKMIEFDKYKDSYIEEKTRLQTKLKKHLSQIKQQITNILSDLYPEIDFIEFDTVIMFNLTDNHIQMILNDLESFNPDISPDSDVSTENILQITIPYQKSLEFSTLTSAYIIEINKQSKYYKLYKSIEQFDLIQG